MTAMPKYDDDPAYDKPLGDLIREVKGRTHSPAAYDKVPDAVLDKLATRADELEAALDLLIEADYYERHEDGCLRCHICGEHVDDAMVHPDGKPLHHIVHGGPSQAESVDATGEGEA